MQKGSTLLIRAAEQRCSSELSSLPNCLARSPGLCPHGNGNGAAATQEMLNLASRESSGNAGAPAKNSWWQSNWNIFIGRQGLVGAPCGTSVLCNRTRHGPLQAGDNPSHEDHVLKHNRVVVMPVTGGCDGRLSGRCGAAAGPSQRKWSQTASRSEWKCGYLC